MRLARILPTLALGTVWVPTAVGDADFLQVRRNNPYNLNIERSDEPEKYFHEASFHPRYDGRFAEEVLPYDEQQKVLKNLVKTYLATFKELGVETWLMHDSLLGWWWGKKILPWDMDINVQVSEASMHYLASYYNMSTFHYKAPRSSHGRDYLLEVNPHYIDREQTDSLNVVDARWIDMESGMYVDIITVRYNLTHPAGEGILSCKDGHEFRDTYLFPLLSTTFEGSPVNIPYRYKDMLEAEYGSQALAETHFADHVFDDEKMEWLPEADSNVELR